MSESADRDASIAPAGWLPPRAPGAPAEAGAEEPEGERGVGGESGRRHPVDRAEPPPLLEAVGGPLGVAESVLPAAAFVTTYTASGQETTPALVVAVALGTVFALARIVRRQTPQFALAGLAGLALSAYVVSRTGRASDFFLPGLLANAAYALAYAISIAVRWPLLGVIVAVFRGGDMAWRKDPLEVRRYARASWIWVALFSLRLAVQLPLYLADAVVALGVARVAMGVPLFAVGIWLSWLILRPRAADAARPGG